MALSASDTFITPSALHKLSATVFAELQALLRAPLTQPDPHVNAAFADLDWETGKYVGEPLRNRHSM